MSAESVYEAHNTLVQPVLGLRSFLLLLLRLLAMFNVQASSQQPDVVERSSLAPTGSCFKQRLANGKCVGLLSRVNTKAECCEQGGYYLNRMLTQQEYLNDHLIFESGTPNCLDACNEVQKPTCDGYFCPEGHFCRLVDGQPACHCRPQCELTDYLSGPICTSNLRRFTDRCRLKRAYCDSPNQVFEIVPCANNDKLFCAPQNRLPEFSKLTSWLEAGERSSRSVGRIQRRPRPTTWLMNRLIALRKRGSVWLGLNEPSNVLRSEMDPDLFKLIQADEERKRLESAANDAVEGLVCPAGQYCLLRQFDGRPACVDLLAERTQLEGVKPCAGGQFARPKCGVDNRTYESPCELQLAGLEKQLEIRIAYDGPCVAHATCNNVRCPRDGMVCRPHHATGLPMCLDCATLPTDCNASFRRAQAGDFKRDATVAQSTSIGDPMWTAQTQTNGWPVVCGSNRRTYANTCFLHIVNCLSNKFVDLRPPQFCSLSSAQSSAETSEQS